MCNVEKREKKIIIGEKWHGKVKWEVTEKGVFQFLLWQEETRPVQTS